MCRGGEGHLFWAGSADHLEGVLRTLRENGALRRRSRRLLRLEEHKVGVGYRWLLQPTPHSYRRMNRSSSEVHTKVHDV